MFLCLLKLLITVFLFCDLKRKLESNWQVIRDEGLSVLDKKSGGFIPEEENLKSQGDWKQFTLYQRGRKSEAACRKTPQTCAIIDTMRDATSCKRGQVSLKVNSKQAREDCFSSKR